MSEENDLKKMIELLMAGKRKEAAAGLLNLYPRITKKELRLQLIDASLSTLDPIKENQKLIEMSAEGVKIAEDLQMPNLQAHFMGNKANFLMDKITFLQHQRYSLKLAPGWIEFSTEADKKQYEIIIKEVERREKEINTLLAQAMILAEQSGDKKVLGRILMFRGSVESTRHLHHKIKCFSGNSKVKRWLKFKFLHHLILKYPFIFNKKQSKRLKSFVASFTSDFLRAAQVFEEIKDPTAGYAYHNLANNLKSAYRFKKAKKYLKKAESVAKEYNDTLLMRQVKIMKKAIKAKNRDIPDYIGGETRNLNGV